MRSSGIGMLQRLAHEYGVQTAYYDVNRQRQTASVEVLLAVLQSLGAPVARVEDVPQALRERRQAAWERPVEPVIVAWNGQPPLIELRLPANLADVPMAGQLTLDTGERRVWQWRGVDLPLLWESKVEGRRYQVRALDLAERLPNGYHRLELEVAGRIVESLVIAAPYRAYRPPEGEGGRAWGVFLPLYALHGQRSWQSGDLTDLEALAAWVGQEGGGVVATLPLLPTFPQQSCPYAPVSRLMWSDLYIDVTAAPELRTCGPAQALLASDEFQRELDLLRRAPLMNYAGLMSMKRRVLEELARCVFAEPSPRQRALQAFAESHPMVEEYARFRAACEKQRAPWRSWPQPLRGGALKEGDYDEEARRYHLYAQWLAHEQMEALFRSAAGKQVQFYLDLPLGVDPDGYDAWSQQGVFALGVTAGAPPDTVFVRGQDWHTPPLHPERLREQGYGYYLACLRHHLQHGGILRIDHVMGFHRLFWIPQGCQPGDGVYVRYPADELYAILSLESHRYRCIPVGENLGTVPVRINRTLREHDVHRMYVVQYELATEADQALGRPPRDSVASINTHDMPTFAGFWQGLDIKERQELGLLDERGVQEETMRREASKKALVAFLRGAGFLSGPSTDPGTVLQATIAFLSASPARLVLANLEDLWLETQPQNVPGTGDDFGNWRHRARYSLEEMRRLPQVNRLLGEIRRYRSSGRK
ncbi:MAG: 4-alpha-glucanotransferase [Chloroflexi bacterium]|nr:MAG: 4-alpha-glucanotransferase [Chloroflexota bacterium]